MVLCQGEELSVFEQIDVPSELSAMIAVFDALAGSRVFGCRCRRAPPFATADLVALR